MKYTTKDRFCALCKRSGLPDVHTVKLFDDVVSRYSEPHRKYHDLKHIDRSLGLFHESGVTDPMIPRRGTNRENLMIDLDLSILGSDVEEYQMYSRDMREEYCFLSDEEYNQRRVTELESYLAGEIFATERFMNLEQQARSNIGVELESLK